MSVVRSIPASLGQRLLGMMERYRGAESPLNVPVLYRLRGPLDREALAAALDALVARHEALRTTYEITARRLVQHIHDHRPVGLEKRTLWGVRGELDAAMVAEARAPFDLTVAPVRAVLWEAGPEENVLLLNIHHLSTDGWSGGVIAEDLGRLYRPGDVVPELPNTSWQYGEFCAWQQRRLDDGLLAEQQRFWRDRLAGTRPPSLPGARETGAATGRLPAVRVFELPAETVEGLANLCRERRVTTFIAGLATFASVLHARSGDTDFGLASMFANRTRTELAGTVGFLSNLVVLRLTLPARPAFDDVLDAARDMVYDALAYQEIPYHVVPQDRGERGAGLENILFQVTAGPDYQLRLAGLDVTQLAPPDGVGSRFDLEFALMPGTGSMRGMVWFDRRRFDPAWIDRLVADFTRMASGVSVEPTRPVADHLADR